MITDNVEGLAQWNIRMPEYRESGLSAFVRVKDEAEYLPYALRSIYEWCDQIVVAVQGSQSDETSDIALAWGELDKVRTVFYPFESVANGPGHGDQQRGSVHERAYFYNWTLAKTTRSHLMKWDGDMVAVPGAGETIRQAMTTHDSVTFKGVEIVDRELHISASHPYANAETRVFRTGHYETAAFCERLVGADKGKVIDEPLYLHFKWAKARHSATKAWPEDWKKHAHFVKLEQRAKPGKKYEGPVPW